MKIIADANIPHVKRCCSSVGDVQVVPGRDITPAVVADADALLVRSITPVNEELLAGSRVRFVGTATIGFDHVDIEYLRRNAIGFASAPGSNANSAAEYVIAGLLEIAQRIDIVLKGRLIGVVGVGNVGSRVAAKCEALGMRVLRNDPPLQRQTNDPVYVPIENLFGCDFVTFHTPLTFSGIDETFHLADRTFFESVRPGCVLINASRGAVVDGEALKHAIRTGKTKAVTLDVWENEPDIDVELLEMVDLASPHIAGYSLDGKIAGLIMIYEALCRHFDLQPQFGVGAFLPDATVPTLRIDSLGRPHEAQLLDAVRHLYDIADDDRALRRIAELPARQRGAFFDRLRKTYRVRREFHNTRVELAEPDETLAVKLRGIGFDVARSD